VANVELVIVIIKAKSKGHKSNSGINITKAEISILGHMTVMSGFDT